MKVAFQGVKLYLPEHLPDVRSPVLKFLKFKTTLDNNGCICDRLRENRAQRGVRKYREKIDRFLKNVLFQADGRERLGLL